MNEMDMGSGIITSGTVAAVSSPAGRGGVALIRISGKESIPIAESIFFPKNGKKLTDHRPRTLVYGGISAENRIVDDCLVSYFRAPHSYTGEDCVEISCHGGILLSGKILSQIFAAGAVPAAPGEFTKRAFVNGKISLTEADAVIKTINAENDEQLKLSRSHMEGKLTKEFSAISASLTSVLAHCYVLCDYPDEDLSEISDSEVTAMLSEAERRLSGLISTYRTGHAVSEGIKTAIVGKPNVGKSSLLNSLLGFDRAIVSDIPGTTRDTLDETLDLGRIILKISDTAGIRSGEKADEIERLGIERSIGKISSAELVLAVFDLSSPFDEEDRAVLSALSAADVTRIAVFNKSDLPQRLDRSGILSQGFTACCDISAENGNNIDVLGSLIESLFFDEKIDCLETPVISAAWQYENIKKALECIVSAEESIASGFPVDAAGIDIERAIALLDETDGRRASEKIVNSVFSHFCVGK